MLGMDDEYHINVLGTQIKVAQAYEFRTEGNVLRLQPDSVVTPMRILLQGVGVRLLQTFAQDEKERESYKQAQEILDNYENIVQAFSFAKGLVNCFEDFDVFAKNLFEIEGRRKEGIARKDVNTIVKRLYDDGKYAFETSMEIKEFAWAYCQKLKSWMNIRTWGKNPAARMESFLKSTFTDRITECLGELGYAKTVSDSEASIKELIEVYSANKAAYQGNSFLKLNGGRCFCLATLNGKELVAVSGNDEKERAQKIEEVLKVLCKERDEATVCYLDDNFLIPRERSDVQAFKRMRGVPCEFWGYERYGDIKEQNLDIQGLYCAERKILAKVFASVIKTIPKSFVDCITAREDISELKDLVFYSKYAPCNLCLPLLEPFTYYSITYDKEFFGKPIRIRIGKAYCKYMTAE